MVEKTKASQGASVSKTGNMSIQSTLQAAKWDKKDPQGTNTSPHICQDNSPNENLPSRAPTARAKKPAMKQEIGEHIGRQLRSVYDDVLAQPVPDRFLDLLRALEKEPK